MSILEDKLALGEFISIDLNDIQSDIINENNHIIPCPSEESCEFINKFLEDSDVGKEEKYKQHINSQDIKPLILKKLKEFEENYKGDKDQFLLIESEIFNLLKYRHDSERGEIRCCIAAIKGEIPWPIKDCYSIVDWLNK